MKTLKQKSIALLLASAIVLPLMPMSALGAAEWDIGPIAVPAASMGAPDPVSVPVDALDKTTEPAATESTSDAEAAKGPADDTPGSDAAGADISETETATAPAPDAENAIDTTESALSVTDEINAMSAIRPMASTIPVTFTAGEDVAAIKSKVQYALENAEKGDTVTVDCSGSKTNANDTLDLVIKEGVTLQWRARYGGSIGVPLISVSGKGIFEVVLASSSYSIANRGAGSVIAVESEAKVLITRGSITSSSGDAIVFNGANNYTVLEVALNGVVSSSSGSAITSNAQNGHVLIEGGAISSSGENPTINFVGADVEVASGAVSAGNGSAISSGGVITIRGGSVYNSSSTKAAVYSSSSAQTVFISGNCSVSANGSSSAVDAKKIIVSGGTVSAENGPTIYARNISGGSTVSINGGFVNSNTGDVVYADRPEIGGVRINGGTVTAKTGLAVSASVSGSGSYVVISGGTLFAYGAKLVGKGNVVYVNKYDSPNTDLTTENFQPTGQSVIIAYNSNHSPSSDPEIGSSDYLTVSSDATAEWDIQNSSHGISYKSPSGSVHGFIKLDVPFSTLHTLTVVNGTGSGKYNEGANASIKASAAPAGQVFNVWTTNKEGAFGDASNANTTFTMPAYPATVTATYRYVAPNLGIDYKDEVLNGLVSGGTYSFNGGDGVIVPGTTYAIPETWMSGETLPIVRKGDGNAASSTPQSLTVPTRPGAPAPKGKGETYDGRNDGRITDVTGAMEWRKSTEGVWHPVSGTEITGLSSGDYYVRLKQAGNSFAGTPAAVNIWKGDPTEITAAVPVKLIFAAFEADKGVITAPKYYIQNMGRNSLDVSIESLAIMDPAETNLTTNPAVDGDMSLKLKGISYGGSSAFDDTGFLTKSDSINKFIGTLTPHGYLYPIKGFTLEGGYVGNFDKAKKPVYMLGFKFALHEYS
ncbi:MAG: hypothetical protein LBK04_07710 [Clostridiales Family XIII bacterium]|jgi:hypothetical protein|nr:hypothetical protein [Clostridiales Family XIII bacterium]